MKKDGKHKKIQRKILLYLDNELREKERELVRNHLQNCPYCSRTLEVYERLWKKLPSAEKVPPPYLWEKLQNRLARIEKSSLFSFRLQQFLRRYAFSAFLAILISFAVAAGAFIGSPSSSPSFELAAYIRQTSGPAEEFELDRFSISPPGSLPDIYDELESAGQMSKR